MAVRTTGSEVEAVLTDDYDGSTSLTPYIAAASSIVDRLAALDSSGVLTSAQLTLIETWLSAHCYCMMDRLMQSEGKGKSSGTVMGVFGKRLESTTYGQMALSLDWSGRLSSIGKQRARMDWLGKAPSSQIDYEDRD